MNVSDKIFALKRTPPFDRLSDNAQVLIAEVCGYRELRPGAFLATEKTVLRRLYITVGGAIEDSDGNRLPPVLGLRSVLFDVPSEVAVTASAEEGARMLTIERGHFFTILYECPELAVGFLTQPGYDEEVSANGETAP